MGAINIKSALSKPLANYVAKQIRRWSSNPVDTQHKVFLELLKGSQNTVFAREHDFSAIRTYSDFRERVPVRDYEMIKHYIERIKEGETDVLWKGKPKYLSKTSGTTSGVKYIPITKESIPNHINSARNALLMYIHETKKADFVSGKMIFLSGSPKLDMTGNIPTGRLSGIVNHYVPSYLRKNQMPSYETNCIEDWEEKVDRIVEETIHEDMTLISGIPPWVQMYLEKLEQKAQKKIKDIFPNFSLFVYGGVNYKPYKNKFESTIGKAVDSIELYPTSEGFIAFQDSQKQEGLLLILNSGIFYEFIPVSDYLRENPTRISLEDIELGINYAIILNTNAGLWGYNIGDTVKFVSKNPYRLVVTGRIKHFLSAFGEHIISEEVEKAVLKATTNENIEIVEFTVAPQINPANELPYHEWFVEFATFPKNIEIFRLNLDNAVRQQNIYYNDLIKGNVLQPLKLRVMQKNAFINYMKSKGKLGGQNKVPRLSNDRIIADEISKWIEN